MYLTLRSIVCSIVRIGKLFEVEKGPPELEDEKVKSYLSDELTLRKMPSM